MEKAGLTVLRDLIARGIYRIYSAFIDGFLTWNEVNNPVVDGKLP
jgi:hypothetical protein